MGRGGALSTPPPLRPLSVLLSWRHRALPRLAVDAVCLAVLAFACVKQVHALELVLDLPLWDEADYLHNGVTLPTRGLPAAEWGPLYSLWYFALSSVWPDPVALHDGSFRLLLLLTTLAGYVLLRRVEAPPWLALAGMSVYLLSAAPHVLPRPTMLALLVLLLALVAASFLREPEDFCAVAGLGLLVASFARPEYFLSFLLAVGLLVLLLGRRAWKDRAHLPRRLAFAGGCGLVALALLGVLGSPFSDTTHRRFYAFCQHFAVNYVERTGFQAEPWGECPKVIRAAFGEVDTVGAAARSNPDAFLVHLRTNLERYPSAFLQLFFREYGGVSPYPPGALWPPTRREPLEHAGHLLLLLVAASPLLLVATKWKHLRAALMKPQIWRTGGVLLAVLLPVSLSAVLIAPRTHYLVIQGVMGLAFLAALGSALGEPSSHGRPRLSLGLALVLALASPDLSQRQGASAPSRWANRQFVESFRSLGLSARLAPGEEVGILDTHGGLVAYLGPGYRRVPAYRKRPQEPFTAFLRRERVHVFIADARLGQYENFAQDAELQALLKDPGAFGFRVRPLPGTEFQLVLPSAWAEEGAAVMKPPRPEPQAQAR